MLRWVESRRGLGHLPRKKSFLRKNYKPGCILTQFLTCSKHGQSLQALGHGFLRFNREPKLTKTAKKFTVRQKVERSHQHPSPPPPKYAIACSVCKYVATFVSMFVGHTTVIRPTVWKTVKKYRETFVIDRQRHIAMLLLDFPYL